MESLIIVKIGGAIIDDYKKLNVFLGAFNRLKGKKILVHGGGNIATDIGKKMGIESKKIDGRRITDDSFIDIALMVYGGLINKKIVARLQAKNCNALGLSGIDGDCIRAQKRQKINGIDYGWVGYPIKVNTLFLNNLLKNNIAPVLASLTHDGKGNMLNTNADTIASCIASNMNKSYKIDLIYAFELDGIMKDISNANSLIGHINMDKYISLKKDGLIFDGMIPKVCSAFEALKQGANSVKIIKYDCIDKVYNSDFVHYTNICK